MARQPKKPRANKSYNDKRHKIKCASCGIDTTSPRIKNIRGIAKWICSLCFDRMAARNGT